jgi:hypothetical protein
MLSIFGVSIVLYFMPIKLDYLFFIHPVYIYDVFMLFSKTLPLQYEMLAGAIAGLCQVSFNCSVAFSY